MVSNRRIFVGATACLARVPDKSKPDEASRRPYKFSVFVMLVIVCALVMGSNPVQAQGDSLRRYPVIPAIRGGVASQVRTIVARGKRLGNRLNVFSKIGDSNTAFTYFLTPIGTGSYSLYGYGDLQDTVNFFSAEVAHTNNSFANESIAAIPGWTSGDLLNPARANSGVCAAGETPVACELRVVRPSIALIMVGTNDVAVSDVRTFAANVDQIVVACQKAGVVPVLSTIPYRFDPAYATANVIPFNEAIVRIAARRAIPLWNYWLAVDGLPNAGISIDQVHPSVPGDGQTAVFDEAHLTTGFTVRNLNALQVLNALRPLLK